MYPILASPLASMWQSFFPARNGKQLLMELLSRDRDCTPSPCVDLVELSFFVGKAIHNLASV